MQEIPSKKSLPSTVDRRRWLQFMAAAGAGAAVPAWAQFRVEISGVGATRIPVALGPFRDEAGTAQPTSVIVRTNLERTGLFKIVDASADRLDETSLPKLTDIRARGADALLAGSVSRLADGRVDVRYRLWDVLKARESGGQSLVVHPGDLRLAAHRISDDLYEKLTGERGVFATRIAYVVKAGRNHSLMVAGADGEGAQPAFTSIQPIISPAWSPDGRQLAYVSFDPGKAVVMVQDIATGKRRVVASFKGTNSAPAWSPDGRQLAVTLSRDAIAQIYVMNSDGGGVRRLTTSSGIDTEAAWTPDGKGLYFVSDRGGSPQIYRMSAEGGSAQRVTFQGDYNISPALSADGRWLAYISRVGGGFRLHLMDIASGEVKALTDTRDDESPSFAPNSRQIMYATRQGGRDVLVTTSLDGRIKATLVSSQADVREPVWGPFEESAGRR